MNYGLSAPPAVQWLLGAEKGVYDAVRTFIAGAAPRDYVDVAGPPTDKDLIHYFERKGQTVPLPCVRLKMKMVKNNTTGEDGVEVTCSDADLAEIVRWSRVKALKRAH